MRWRREQPEQIASAEGGETLPCARCETPLTFLGDRDFHEGTRAWGFVLGDLGELLTGGTKLEMWGCETCGHVEFFLPNVR